MTYVFVLTHEKQSQAPCHPAVARKLLTARQVAVWRRYPFTIILKPPVPPGTQLTLPFDGGEAQSLTPVLPLRLKIDPGSRTTGLALLHETTGRVLFAVELTHRSPQITHALADRRALRRNRR